MQEVEAMSKRLLCYYKTVFWAENSKKIKNFKPFRLDPPPPPLPQVTEQHPGFPLIIILVNIMNINVIIWGGHCEAHRMRGWRQAIFKRKGMMEKGGKGKNTWFSLGLRLFITNAQVTHSQGNPLTGCLTRAHPTKTLLQSSSFGIGLVAGESTDLTPKKVLGHDADRGRPCRVICKTAVIHRCKWIFDFADACVNKKIQPWAQVFLWNPLD